MNENYKRTCHKLTVRSQNDSSYTVKCVHIEVTPLFYFEYNTACVFIKYPYNTMNVIIAPQNTTDAASSKQQ